MTSPSPRGCVLLREDFQASLTAPHVDCQVESGMDLKRFSNCAGQLVEVR